MGVVARLHKSKILKNLGINDPKSWNSSLWNLIGNQSLSGETVTEETALTYSPIWNAVNLYCSIASLPLQLLRKSDNKTVKVKDNKLYHVLHDKFNPYMTAQIGREVSIAHMLLWGNSYAEIVRNGYGEVIELWPITPNRVTVKMNKGELFYEINVGTKTVTLPRSKVLHIPGLGFDGIVGYSVVTMAQRSIGLGMALETFGATFFGQGTHPGTVFSHPTVLSPSGHANLKKELESKYSGLGKSHRMMLLDEGMTMEKVGVNPNDSQFIESKMFSVTDVARWFNLPVHKLKEMSKSSFNNIEEEKLSYVSDSLMPVIIRYESNYNMQLLTDNEQYTQEIYTRHNVDSLLRGNCEARAKYYQIMWGISQLTGNMIADLEGWDHFDGGDERFVPLNMIPLSKIDQYLDMLKKTSTKPKPETEGPEPKENETPENIMRLIDQSREN